MVGNGNCASKKELLQSINQVSFAIDDLLLFLDTHPREKRALEYFSELSARRNELLKKYAEKDPRIHYEILGGNRGFVRSYHSP